MSPLCSSFSFNNLFPITLVQEASPPTKKTKPPAFNIFSPCRTKRIQSPHALTDFSAHFSRTYAGLLLSRTKLIKAPS
ncbi:hypothetical protein HanIR_Chr04g0154931 [Helianthus annuus]|nr:hypothetical protein HanIR_Chr04g0154931 [Helianthus annuus]